METQEIEANGGTVIVQGDDQYPFDAKEAQAQVSLGRGVILTHVFRKPTLKDHLDREKHVRRINRLGPDREITPDNDESDANAGFYNDLILRAYAVKGGETVANYDAEQCQSFTFEAKTKAFTALYSSTFEVEDDDDPLAILFERDGSMKIKQEMAGPGLDPDYVITYEIKTPSKSQRQDYDANAVHVKHKQEKRNKLKFETVVNLNKGVKLFAQLFVGVEGGMVNGQSFSPEQKNQFLEQIDPLFANAVIDAAVNHFQQASD